MQLQRVAVGRGSRGPFAVGRSPVRPPSRPASPSYIVHPSLLPRHPGSLARSGPQGGFRRRFHLPVEEADHVAVARCTTTSPVTHRQTTAAPVKRPEERFDPSSEPARALAEVAKRASAAPMSRRPRPPRLCHSPLPGRYTPSCPVLPLPVRASALLSGTISRAGVKMQKLQRDHFASLDTRSSGPPRVITHASSCRRVTYRS